MLVSVRYATVQKSILCVWLIFSTEILFSVYHENRPKCLLLQTWWHGRLPAMFLPLRSGSFLFSAGQWLGNVQICFSKATAVPAPSPGTAAARFLLTDWTGCTDLDTALNWKIGMDGYAQNTIHSNNEAFFPKDATCYKSMWLRTCISTSNAEKMLPICILCYCMYSMMCSTQAEKITFNGEKMTNDILVGLRIFVDE